MSVQDLGVELAAGGLLWRDAETHERLAVVHRKRYDDWSLPKGKFDPDADETWEDTAVREVREETGCEVELGPFLDGTSYLVDGRPKVVLFWNMVLEEENEFEPSEEVDELQWVSVPEAMKLLDYPDQRRLVARTAGQSLLVDCHVKPPDKHFWRWMISLPPWPRGASHGRLFSLLGSYRTELSHLIARVRRERRSRYSGRCPWTGIVRRISGDPTSYPTKMTRLLAGLCREQGQRTFETPPWAEAACSLLEDARLALDENDTDRAWRCFLAAQRLELFGLDELGRDALRTRAETIAREADDKLDSWRKDAVEDHLGERGKLKDDVTVEEVYEAALVLHGHFHNQYHKIGLLKRQSSILALIAFLTTAFFLAFYWFAGPFFGPEVDTTSVPFVLSVALFGVIGASVSGFLALARAGTRRKIPSQIVSSWVTFARPMIGAAAALVLFGFLQSGLLRLGEPTPGLALVVAFAAGSSERLLDRAVRSVEGG